MPQKVLMIFLLSIAALGEPSTELRITKQADLMFSDSYAGSPPETISPSSSGASRFLISGKPHAVIEIELPTGEHPLDSSPNSIAVSGWTANHGAKAQLGPSGMVLLSLGAKRQELPSGAMKADHRGTHAVKVRYLGDLNWHQEFAFHKLRVLQSIKLIKVSDLQFENTFPGSPEETIESNSSNHAEFVVLGEPNRFFSVQLPLNNSIWLTTGKGRLNERILITQFSSAPSNQGQLDANGKSSVFVGANRARVPDHVSAGLYEAWFPVRVVYY